MSLSPQFLEELRGRTLLSALIGRTVKLTRAGREWKACCPFHHEKSPSFYVNDEKGFYHCFGCSVHGDAIRWMTDQRGLSFIDAVKELAQTAGIEVPAPDPRAAARDDRAAGLHDVMAAASTWFSQQFQGDAGAEARAYLGRRGINPATAEAFGMGFAPDSRSALKIALARFGDAMLIEAGLLILVEDKEPYDRFRGRLMIPIRDPRGRVIAFGGRIMGTGEPKYLNSPDTPLFDKGRTLYNLDRASAAARKSGRLLVVEGYMDVIALAQAGIGEVVAPLGTALTEAQIERLWRMVDVPILCLDGDKAGRKAAIRAGERALPLLKPGHSLDFALLPEGRDPDDLVREGGPAAIEAVIGERTPLVSLLWDHELAASPVATPEARAGLRQRVDTLVATIADGEVQRHYKASMRERFDAVFFPPRAPWQERQPARRPVNGRPGNGRQGNGGRYVQPAPPGVVARSIGGVGVDPLYARAVIAGLLRHPAMIRVCAEALAALPIADPSLDTIRRFMIDHAYSVDDIDPAGIDTILSDAGFASLVLDLRRSNGLAFSFTRSDAHAEIARRDLAMAIENLASRPELDAALEAANARLAVLVDEHGLAEQDRTRNAQAEANKALAALYGEDD